MSPAPMSNPPRSSPESSQAPNSTSAMAFQPSAQGSILRRTRPSHVQTGLQANSLLNSLPASAISASSVASSSQHDSPIMSPENPVLTTSSSIQPSPEPYRGRDVEQFPPPPFTLGDPLLLQHKNSSNSINPSSATTTGSMAEALQQCTSSNSGNKNLIRRFSSRASRFARTSRRQSSVAPKSRDGSLGPGIIRRRSDSTNTAPPDNVFTDSDDEIVADERDEYMSFALPGAQLREFSSTSNPGSIAGSATPIDPPAGPVIPMALVKGTWIFKMSKKRKYKKIFLVLDLEAAKIIWNRSRPAKCIYIDDIKDIRIGSDTRQYRADFNLPDSEEGRFFSIMYAVADKSKSKLMHLLAEDEETFSNWVTALDAISKHRQDLMTSLMSFNDKAIRSYWNSEMTKQFEGKPHSADEEEIDMPGVERVCRNLHIHVAYKELQNKFTVADATRTGRLNFAEFQVFVREMKVRADIRTVYLERASNPQSGLAWHEFALFLCEVQGEDVESDVRNWEAKFNRFARRSKKEGDLRDADADVPRMTEQALVAYLTSTFNLPVLREPTEYTLDRPLHEYFISSSHNTYLLGRQVADDSSIEGYITALMKGCRSIEIDCWDGSDGQPIVQHGYALTTYISFREVIHIVNKYAFVTSHFPLWVSLEVHCDAPQQGVMADIMREIFGSRLVTEPLDSSSDKLPSPTELRDRVLVKVKAATDDEPRKSKAPGSAGRRRGNSLTSPYTKPVALDNATIPTQYLSQSPLLGARDASRRIVGKRYNTITEGVEIDPVSSSTSDNDSGGEGTPKKKQSKIAPPLGILGVYGGGVKYEGPSTLECKTPYHIVSFMEGGFRSLVKAKDHKDVLYRHNMRFMMRVYPQYTRISSHNFNPLMYWRKGVQMAALNWQTYDLGMQLNQAMFDGGTDQSGYVLKPHSMREIRVLPDGLPQEAIGKLERKNVTFTIDVISAQQLMRPANLPSNRSLDPYVEVEVFHANDKRDKHDSSVGIPIPTDTPLKQRTRVVKENGFNPTFEKTCKFNVTTKYPELIFVRFSVKLSPDGDNPSERVAPMATYIAKLSNLKQGYRTLPLFDSSGDRYLFSTLFCRIKVDAPTSVYVPHPPDVSETVGKFKNFGNKVFNRGASSKGGSFEKTMEKTVEKTSIDSGTSDNSQQHLLRTV
ncbi:phosphatidylinositol-specific phospholipase C [Pseudomassariella vexata]|uniref:Phosphoinositide phospholipase C n=1 Tax=Pseudomassariella vexata TaxID=1141098 RepID=A0A1Y2EHP7_9PEZI|nr:phosphatidylinositol-specific phospholipase C [Pseudomassariella vexata]ORY71099.1 phosphatidylinositol-specific phospholipase C [Pseudomassariella vexata]